MNLKYKLKNFFDYIVIIGTPLNLIFEYMQVTLVYPIVYIPRIFQALFAVFCDIIITFIVYYLLRKIYKDKLWINKWDFKKSFLVIVFGAILVIIGEKIALNIGLWSYKDTMPVVQFIKVGFTPILQLAITPLITLYLASKIIKINK